MKDGAGLAVLATRIRATCANAADTDLAEEAEVLEAALAEIEATVRAIHDQPPERMLDHAASFLNGSSLVIVGWLWLDMALAAQRLTDTDDATARLKAGKLATCRYFIWHELPIAMSMLKLVASGRDLDSGLAADAF